MVTIKIPETLYKYFEQAGNQVHVQAGAQIYMIINREALSSFVQLNPILVLMPLVT